MKRANKFLAVVCVLALVLCATACNKNTDGTSNSSGASVVVGTENTLDSIVISSDASSNQNADTTLSSESKVTVQTNENGEYTINGATFDTLYGSQLPNYLNHQYYFDDIAVPVAESNFIFITEFSTLSEQAYNGYYPLTSEGFVDLAYEFTNGDLETFSFSTFGDYFREFSEHQILSTYIVLEKAKEQGLVLSEDTYQDIEDHIAQLRNIAGNELGMDLDSYLKIFYGPDCDEGAYRKVLENYFLTILYSDDFVANYEIDESELQAPHVCHALYYARDGVATEEEMEAAKTDAEAFLAEISTPEDIQTLGAERLADGSVAECADYVVERGVFVQEFEDWAYDESRQVGDVGILKTAFGYHVMGYMGLAEISETTQINMAYEALSEEIGEIALNEVHDFYTNDIIVQPDPVLDENGVNPNENVTVDPTLNLDGDGNLIVEPSINILDGGQSASDDGSGSGMKTLRYALAGVGGGCLVAALVLVVLMFVRGKKNDKSSSEEDIIVVDKEKLEQIEEENNEDNLDNE